MSHVSSQYEPHRSILSTAEQLHLMGLSDTQTATLNPDTLFDTACLHDEEPQVQLISSKFSSGSGSFDMSAARDSDDESNEDSEVSSERAVSRLDKRRGRKNSALCLVPSTVREGPLNSVFKHPSYLQSQSCSMSGSQEQGQAASAVAVRDNDTDKIQHQGLLLPCSQGDSLFSKALLGLIESALDPS